ncbi:MAG: AAA family ATPase [Bacteroidetes bacterium]|nr:MAG: AAA family ATPase [Bacteroidota bacterium]
MLPDSENALFDIAFDVVNNTACNLFLTGKAGTGKTTFLKYVQQHTRKQTVTTAPTGVAAINAGGVTLHSFFQLPFIPYISEGFFNNGATTNRHDLLSKIRFNSDKIGLLKDLELLIIDEVSMLRADMLDAIDDILRHYRQNRSTPFGGVQVLLIGDLFQLPPVVSDSEWPLLRNEYESPFFFSAKVIRDNPPLFIELKKIYRQNEERFINLLNNIRNNEVEEWDLQLLEEHYQPEMQDASENTITLCTHNYKADQINQQQLNQLDGELYTFTADVKGDFSDKAYPTEEKLTLKVGAQVMFIKNDVEKRYFNGKLATVKAISDGKITLELEGSGTELQLEKEKWQNIRYKVNNDTNRIEEEEIGSFTQYPVRLAWAITIHKSQGLTFDRAVIDAGQSFAAGQVYVALSRCRTLDGVTLLSRISGQSIKSDERIIQFATQENSMDEVLRVLEQEKPAYAAQVLINTFSWDKLLSRLNAFYEITRAKNLPEKEKLHVLVRGMVEKAAEQNEVAGKFMAQLKYIFHNKPIDETLLNERVTKAKQYFANTLNNDIVSVITEIHSLLKLKPKVKQYLGDLAELEKLVWAKIRDIEKITFGDMHFEVPTLQAPVEKITVEKGKKAEKGESNRITLGLYKEGKTVSEIAAERSMAESTIEGHLAEYISTGEVNILDFMSSELLDQLTRLINELGGDQAKPIKEELGDSVSYGQIRMAVNYLKAKHIAAG